MAKGYLGIDAGTQGLSVVFTDESLNVMATGEGGYDMLPGLEEGCYEQSPDDWEAALVTAMHDLRTKLAEDPEIICVGISGQMHGEVHADKDGNLLGPTRLWCDSCNEEEGTELTKALGVKMPKRITTARWLWTLRNQLDKAKQVAHITTPAGWLAFRLTGQWNLGIGDAAGMFPIDQETLNYDARLLKIFDELTPVGIKPLAELLPQVRCAGEDGGHLNSRGCQLLGLAEGTPVAPAEGDQPASLAGSLIGSAGMVSVSFGTSVCANSVGDRAFQGVSDGVDHFCAPDGKPINMVWLRNGTTFMNTIVEMFGAASDQGDAFANVMPQMLDAADDCGGLLALPFMDDEPGLGVHRGGTAQLIGLNSTNSKPGNAVKAALLSTMFNLRLGSETLDEQGFPRTEIVLAGGLTKTPETGQILANVFDTPVTLLESAEEGTAWGAAVMAKFRSEKDNGTEASWDQFLKSLGKKDSQRFEPESDSVQRLNESYLRYQSLLSCQAAIDVALNDEKLVGNR